MPVTILVGVETRKSDWVGETVGGRWEIIRPLASGGMSSVFVARHVVTQKQTALKLFSDLDGSEPEILERFRREARSAADINHPDIVDILDADTSDGTLYLTMELLHGMDLEQLMAQKEIPALRILEVIEGVLAPLATAHDKGYVHRDLKPGNVFVVNPNTTDECVKLLDFGIARHFADKRVTQTGTAIGTPHYMSPEHATDAKNVGPSADVWSLGVMMYEAIAGAVPFDHETLPGVFVKICTEPHRPLAELVPEVDPHLASLIDRCLAKEPEQRPADAGALLSELNALSDAGAGFSSIHPQARRPASRQRNRFWETAIKQLSSSWQALARKVPTRSRSPWPVSLVAFAVLTAVGVILFSTLSSGSLWSAQSHLLAGLATVIALGVGFVVQRRLRSGRSQTPIPPPSVIPQTVKTEVDDSTVDDIDHELLPHRGPRDAPVKVTLFTDWVLPETWNLWAVLKEILADYPTELQLIWRTLPSLNQTESKLAAYAGHEAYLQQGDNGFWKFHQSLAKGERTFTIPWMVRHGRQAGLHLDQLSGVLKSEQHRAFFEQQCRYAKSRRIKESPTLLIGDQRVTGPASKRQLVRLIERQLDLESKRG